MGRSFFRERQWQWRQGERVDGDRVHAAPLPSLDQEDSTKWIQCGYTTTLKILNISSNKC